MQKNAKKNPTVQEVHKPMAVGSWHGKDAYRLGRKVMLSVFVVSLIYLFLGLMLSFDSLWARAMMAIAMVGAAMGYLYSMGVRAGEGDAAFAEIMYLRQSEGKPVQSSDLSRCYHPAKGFFATLIGVLPFILLSAIFACLAKPVLYTLGALPGWIQGLARQNEFGDALGYYALRPGIGVMDIYRIAVRAMVMPFVNTAVLLGDGATLWAERLSPLLVCIAPVGFGFGYRNGLKARVRINTDILIGDTRKKRKERRERTRRQRGNSPERLI